MDNAVNLTIPELLSEIISNAPVDRAGAWLSLAAEDYPELFAAVEDNLEAAPDAVLAALCREYPIAAAIYLIPHWRAWIANLQAFMLRQRH